ncbi:unnamed protein product [Urochloa decumbens]|uniref:GDSL esterase/lipase n=1 Tax=Urochloa decumbens TaxID=240449 RepID=A0ABC8WLA1_9POAL
MKLLLTACCFLLVLLNGGGVECRRHPDDHGHHRNKQDRMLFVFGDSFVDVGNRPPAADKGLGSRQWFYPYGSSDSAHHNNATGRFSDGLVQSDFMARILGIDDESPPPYRLRKANEVDPSGVNFAIVGSGASSGEGLGAQVDQLRRLVNHGMVDEQDLGDSVALIAFSGAHDYQSVTVTTAADEVRALSAKVTDSIADAVQRLQDLGVSKILVNTAPPFGCQPFRAWSYNYVHCDSFGNTISDTHNAALRHKLGDWQDVMLLDIHAAFGDVVRNRYSPCCAETSGTGDGFCGEVDGNGNALYTLCADPASFFYWDAMHPTQAAWEAVMDNLQPDIQDFLA